VVKNVTGYDMCKLLAGAFGTLSLLTEITVRTSPEAETACTLLLFGLSDFDAIDALSRALNTPHEVSAAAHLPVGIANRSNVVGVATASSAVTAFRLEGLPASLASRARALEALFGQSSRLDQAETKKLWTEIGSVAPLLESTGHCIWRVCPTPSKAPELMRIVRAQFATGKRPLKAALSG
jgi:glycolate oxidase FAD binding subunit